MRLASTPLADGRRAHETVGRGGVDISGLGRPKVARRRTLIRPGSRTGHGHLRGEQRVRLLAPGLPEREAGAEVARNPALKVRQGEGGSAIASVSGPQNGKKSLILVDEEKLAVALGPPLGREVEREQPDFGKKRR